MTVATRQRRPRYAAPAIAPEDAAANARMQTEHIRLLLAGQPEDADTLYWLIGRGVAGEQEWLTRCAERGVQAYGPAALQLHAGAGDAGANPGGGSVPTVAAGVRVPNTAGGH